ncbi:MAG: VOC family protein [Thermoplasmata archaeon]|jgi:catechol 2,3-dioxygenase-like lactoylglutathione lyase family enzyme
MPGTHPEIPTVYCVRLLVRDFRKSWHFYRDRLGLTPMKGHGQPPYGEFVDKDRAVLAIFDRKVMAKAVGLSPGRYSSKNVGRSTVIFSVKDVDRFAQLLRRRRVRLLRGPTNRPDWGLRTIHFQDPDGYLVEVYSAIPT